MQSPIPSMHVLLWLLALTSCFTGNKAAANESEKRPNFVLIIADDLAVGLLGRSSR